MVVKTFPPAHRCVLPRLIPALLVCVTLGLDVPVSGDEPAAEFFPRPSASDIKLDDALKQQVSLQFADTPLADVAAWLAGELGAPVLLDNRALEDAGVNSNTPITRKVAAVEARAGLQLVLGDLDLTYLEQEGVLIITTQDKAESELVTRVYPVGDLTPLVPRSVTHQRGGSMGGGNSKAGQTSPPKPAAEVARSTADEPSQAPQMVPDFDSLVEVVTTTVKPQTWDEVGGPGSISEMVVAKSIVVSQTREVHHEVLKLLRALRAAKQVGEAETAK